MIPYTIERRIDTGVNNVTLGIWLFLASEVMLFGALFSAYALLRTSAPGWPSGRDVLDVRFGLTHTAVLIGATACAWRARGRADRANWLLASLALGAVFLLTKTAEYSGELSHGFRPSSNTFLATYFTLTGLHAAHVLGGMVANAWAWAGRTRVDSAQTTGRIHALGLYWTFVDVVWALIFVLCYLT